MGTNTLQSRSSGETITADFFNDFNTALQTEVVGRNSSGAPTSGQGLGSSTVPWGTGYFNSIVLGGSAIDTSQMTAPANRIVSGATRSSSNQPNYLTANGSALSLIINGDPTDLVFDVNGVAVTCNTDITVASLTAAPSTNNTCLVNMADAADQELTRYWGEQTNEFVAQTSQDATADPLYKYITVDTMGSEISGLIGKFAAFKINNGSNDEYFLAYVKSATELTQCMRGCFLGNTGLPINRIKFANNDTITLMKLTWVFLTNDGTTADVSYQNPVWSFDEPGSPATGDYWMDLGASQWKRYSGSAFVTISRTLIGIAISDASNCVATRSMDFYYSYKDTNTISVERTSATNCQVNNTHGNIYVYSGNLDFKIYKPQWNITTDLASTATNDSYLSETASTYYYLYFKDTGDRVISDIGPIRRDDLLGEYHPNNPWRCVGLVFNNSSSNLEGGVTDGNDRIYPAVALVKDIKNYNQPGGTNVYNQVYTPRTLNTIMGESWFISLSGTTGFTLIPGTYEISYASPMFRVGNSMSRLYDLTNTTEVVAGDSMYTENAHNGAISFGHAIITIESTTTYQVHYGANSERSGDGLGRENAYYSGSYSVFCQVKVTKLK